MRSLALSPYACPHCGQLLQLEAESCGSCGSSICFDPVANAFRYLDAASGEWRDDKDKPVTARPCENVRYGVCNWLVDDRADNWTLCHACRHNRFIPDLSVAGVLDRWRKIEQAKRRMMLGLIRLGLPPQTVKESPQALIFDFLYDASAEQGYAPQLMTGHQSGVVTLNLIEADDVARERLRREMGEPYRTLVGHFRHEVGHYYWHRLVEFSPDLGPFRARFGDERADYQAALANHYAQPPAGGWEDRFVSAYATMHPWEDFAETFAHYLHIVDTLATIGSFGMKLDTPPATAELARPAVDFDPYRADTATLVERWIPLAFALNAVNRSMGQPDLYPFRMSPEIVLKLDFVNRLMAFGAGRYLPGEGEAADIKAMIATLGHGVDLVA